MKCPNCGTEQPKNAKFCRKCGFRLDGMTCPGCGNPVPSSARYCGVCGAPLNPKRKGWKIALIVVLCLSLAVGGVVGGIYVYQSMQTDSGEEASYDNLLILDDTFTDRTVTDEATAILAAQDAAESLGLQNAMEELEPLNTTEAYGDSYYRLQQYYQGYPVYGRAVVVLADENGEAFTLVGNVADVDADLSFTPSVTQTELEESLSAYAEEELELSGEVSLEEASDDALVIYDLYDEETHLAYELSASLDEELYTVVLDANDGEVLVVCEALSSASITGTNSSGTVTVNASVSDENEGTYFLYDSERKINILDLDGTTSQKTVGWSGNGRGGDSSDAEDSTKAILGEQVSSTETNSDGAAIFSDDAINYLDTLSKIYDTYENWGINSLYTIYANYRDGFDSGMNAVGGVVTVDGTKIGYISAGLVTGTSDIDVYAHEYAHYIMSSHIPLTSSYSTAIKEGFADIYGCLVECKIEGWDKPDWSITGDNITVYRDMAEPSSSGNAEYWDVESSSSHEYDESTIISHAAYLMWRGKDSKIGIGKTYGSLSVDKLAELWYRAMLMFPTDCDYNHVCQLVELAAEHMSLSDQQKECISWAFYQVGIAETYTLDADFNLTLYDTNGDSYAEYYASVEVILSEETLSENTVIVYEPDADGTLSFRLDSGKAYKVTLIDNQDDTKQFLFYAYITDKNGYDTLTLYTDFGTVKPGTLSGTIVSASDGSTAIGGASVTVLDGDTVVEELTSDENGVFEAELPQDTYTVQIEMEGYESQTEEVTIEAGEESTLLVSLSAEITDAGARADELFERYINNVLVPEYGRLESGATSEMSSDGGDTGVWLQSGIMTSTVADLDNDGTEECMVFLLVREKKDGEDGVALYANIYEIVGGEVALSDSMYLDRIDDSDWYQHGWNGSLVDVDGSLYFIFETCEWPNEYYAMELNRSVNDMTYSVEEAYMVYAYDGETLEKTHAYQKDGGVAYGGVEYYEYVYENGEVSDSNWLYSSINAAEVDKSGMVYDTYIEAIEYFADVYNLSVDETLMSDTGRYWANMSESIFLDSDRLTRLFAHSVLTEDKESPYTYEQTFIDDTDKDQSEYDQKTDDSDTEIEDGTPNEASRKVAVSNIVLDTAYTDDYYEFGNIYAYDSNGNLVWSYATGSYPATELDAISEIGLRDGRYYFVEGGTVVAMDASTGAVLWENSDFGSYGASAAFAENCICLAGYYGPDFYAVSYGGTTLCEISSFGSEYYWASNVTISGNTALVSLNDGYCEAQIDLATWSYAISDAG